MESNSTMQRDFTILLVLLGVLYMVSQLTSIDVTSGIENSFANTYTLVNQCDGDIVITNADEEVARIAAGETGEYNPPATAVMRLLFEDGEAGWLPLQIENDIELRGREIPAESDIFGRNPEIIACP